MSDKQSIPGIYLSTAYRCLDDVAKKARTPNDAQVLMLGSIANSLSGLLALGIEKAYGVEVLTETLRDIAEG